MKALETLKQEFATLEANYKASPLPMGKEYRAFAKKWKSLESKIRTYNNSTNVMKRAGLKSTRDGAGYRVEYNGIVAHVWLDGCETEYWSIDIDKGDLDLYFMQHKQKSDAIWFLFGEINESLGLSRN